MKFIKWDKEGMKRKKWNDLVWEGDKLGNIHFEHAISIGFAFHSLLHFFIAISYFDYDEELETWMEQRDYSTALLDEMMPVGDDLEIKSQTSLAYVCVRSRFFI